ncbi:hypothetical protein Tco_0162331 [Tanacetum coccineum]
MQRRLIPMPLDITLSHSVHSLWGHDVGSSLSLKGIVDLVYSLSRRFLKSIRDQKDDCNKDKGEAIMQESEAFKESQKEGVQSEGMKYIGIEEFRLKEKCLRRNKKCYGRTRTCLEAEVRKNMVYVWDQFSYLHPLDFEKEKDSEKNGSKKKSHARKKEQVKSKADGSSKNYEIFSEMLNDFDRQDVLDLHRLVKARFVDIVWKDASATVIPLEGDEILRVHGERTLGAAKALMNAKVDEPKLSDIYVVRDYVDVFPEDLSGLPPQRQVEFRIDLVPGAGHQCEVPYRSSALGNARIFWAASRVAR